MFVYAKEIEKIAKFLKISLKQFFETYCDVIESEYCIFEEFKPTKNKIYLKSIVLKQNKEDGRCIFLEDNNNCIIYSFRPLQCESWPVWYMNMTKSEGFREAVEKCEGFEECKCDEEIYFSVEQIEKIIMEEIMLEQEYIKIMKKNKCDIVKVYPFLKNINYNLK